VPVLRSLDRGPRLPNLYQAKMIESPRRHGHHDPRSPASAFALVGERAEEGSLSIAVWENEGGATLLGKESFAAYDRYRIAQERLSP